MGEQEGIQRNKKVGLDTSITQWTSKYSKKEGTSHINITRARGNHDKTSDSTTDHTEDRGFATYSPFGG